MTITTNYDFKVSTSFITDMAVSPKMISDTVTDFVRKDLQVIAEHLVTVDARSDRETLIDVLTEDIHEETKTFLFLTEQREHKHIMFVNYILDYVKV